MGSALPTGDGRSGDERWTGSRVVEPDSAGSGHAARTRLLLHATPGRTPWPPVGGVAGTLLAAVRWRAVRHPLPLQDGRRRTRIRPRRLRTRPPMNG